MGAVEDVRKAMQDFLPPELRELKTRIEAVEREVNELKGSNQEQFQEAERRAERRHKDMMFVTRQGQEIRNLAERLAAVEEKLKEARH